MEHLPRAPIVEAIIDIKVELPSEATTAHLERLWENISDDYPIKKVRHRWEAQFKLEEHKILTHGEAPEIEGFLFWSKDEKQVTQFRRDGFSFSRLKPYQTWEQMQPEAQRLWEIYKAGVLPTRITRLGLRYVNVIDIPSRRFRLEDYFTEPVKVAPELPQHFDQFHVRIVLHYPDNKTKAIITQATTSPSSPHVTSILLDVDVFEQTRLEQQDLNIWKTFSTFRELKNDIFSKSVTRNTLELFK